MGSRFGGVHDPFRRVWLIKQVCSWFAIELNHSTGAPRPVKSLLPFNPWAHSPVNITAVQGARQGIVPHA